MKPSYENQANDLLQRDGFQESADFFNRRYLDFFPGGKDSI
jgi:hypothetical protein